MYLLNYLVSTAPYNPSSLPPRQPYNRTVYRVHQDPAGRPLHLGGRTRTQGVHESGGSLPPSVGANGIQVHQGGIRRKCCLNSEGGAPC